MNNLVMNSKQIFSSIQSKFLMTVVDTFIFIIFLLLNLIISPEIFAQYIPGHEVTIINSEKIDCKQLGITIYSDKLNIQDFKNNLSTIEIANKKIVKKNCLLIDTSKYKLYPKLIIYNFENGSCGYFSKINKKRLKNSKIEQEISEILDINDWCAIHFSISEKNGSFSNVWVWYNSEDLRLISQKIDNDDSYKEKLSQIEFESKVYPNPASNNLKVSLNSSQNQDIQIKLYDISSNEIPINLPSTFHLNKGSNGFEINTVALQNGMYFLTFSKNENILCTSRIIILK